LTKYIDINSQNIIILVFATVVKSTNIESDFLHDLTLILSEKSYSLFKIEI